MRLLGLLFAVGFRVVRDPSELLEFFRELRGALREIRVFADQADNAGSGISELPQALAPGLRLGEILLRRCYGAFEVCLQLAAVLPGAFESFEPLGGPVFGSGEGLSDLAPAREFLG